MVKLIKSLLIITSTIFGLGFGCEAVDKNLKVTLLKKIAQPQPSLSSFTRKMTNWGNQEKSRPSNSPSH